MPVEQAGGHDGGAGGRVGVEQLQHAGVALVQQDVVPETVERRVDDFGGENGGTKSVAGERARVARTVAVCAARRETREGRRKERKKK